MHFLFVYLCIIMLLIIYCSLTQMVKHALQKVNTE